MRTGDLVTQPQAQEPQPLEDLAFYLAVKQQQEQTAIANRTAAGLAILWSLLQFDKLDETTPAWLHAVTLQVEQQFRVSEQVAFDFVQGTKWAIEPLSRPLKKVETLFPVEDFQLAMRATGPATVKRATGTAFSAPVNYSEALSELLAQNVPAGDSGTPQWVLRRIAELEASKARRDAAIATVQEDASSAGKLSSTGAGVKYALNGGRGEVEQLVILDATERLKNRQVIGWARFTEDTFNSQTGERTGPCYFCALLASRGAFYLSENAFKGSNNRIRDAVRNPRGNNRRTRRAFIGDGVAKIHDHCKCTLRVVYRKEDAEDERAKFFLEQWNNSSNMRDYRSKYVMPPPYEVNPAVDLPAVARNRERLAQRLGEDSAQVKWYDRKLAELKAG